MRFGRRLLERGDAAEALPGFREATAILEKTFSRRSARHRAPTVARCFLCNDRECARRIDRLPEAEQQLPRAIAMSEELASADAARVESRRDLVAFHALADQSERAANLQCALTEYQRTLAMGRRWKDAVCSRDSIATSRTARALARCEAELDEATAR